LGSRESSSMVAFISCKRDGLYQEEEVQNYKERFREV